MDSQIYEIWTHKSVTHQWRICESVNWITIGSGNGLAPVVHQAITRTSTDLLWIVLHGINLSAIFTNMQTIYLINQLIEVEWRHLAT